MRATAKTQETGSGLPETLVAEFEGLDLSPYEARVLLAVLRLGSATSAELARHSEVPRTSIYAVVESLSGKGLVQRMPVDGTAQWTSPGRDEVLDRLYGREEDRLKQQRARVERVREMLAQSFPEVPSAAGAYVHVMQGAAQVAGIYDRMLADVESELLVFNRPPYSIASGQVNPNVLAALDRGIEARVLYQEEQWTDPDYESFRTAMGIYHAAGVAGRLVKELPLKLAIADRRVALVAMADPVLPDIGFPATLLVEHPGFASVQAAAFDAMWQAGHRLNDLGAGRAGHGQHRPRPAHGGVPARIGPVAAG